MTTSSFSSNRSLPVTIRAGESVVVRSSRDSVSFYFFYSLAAFRTPFTPDFLCESVVSHSVWLLDD